MMDSDFLRELVVLLVFMGLYLVGSAILLRGHHADLSAVQQGTRRGTEGNAGESKRGGRTGGGTPGEAPVRLNRRRKAMAREQAEQEARRGGQPVQIPALSEDD
jgi:hypothetical protein